MIVSTLRLISRNKEAAAILGLRTPVRWSGLKNMLNWLKSLFGGKKAAEVESAPAAAPAPEAPVAAPLPDLSGNKESAPEASEEAK